MGKRLPYTTNSAIRSALRRLFLRSRERAAALKRDKYTCRSCSVKQSRAKGKEVYVEVHHKDGILNWEIVFECIRKYLLCDPMYLETRCKECHNAGRQESSKPQPRNNCGLRDGAL